MRVFVAISRLNKELWSLGIYLLAVSLDFSIWALAKYPGLVQRD